MLRPVPSSALLFALILGPSCSGGDPILLAEEKQEFVQGLGGAVMLPVLEDSRAAIAALLVQVEALAADPTSTTLSTAADAWREARVSWGRAEAFMFDRLDDLRFVSKMDSPEIDILDIEAEISGTAALTENYIAGLGNKEKGFHAAEHLLFNVDPAMDPPLGALSGSQRRREYLVAVIADLRDRSDEIVATAGDMETGFLSAGTGDSKLVVDQMVNYMILVDEILTDRGLGRPLGFTFGGLPQAEGVESPWAQHSLEDLVADVAGLRALWEGGTDGAPALSLSSMMEMVVPADADRVEAGLLALEQALAAIPAPLLTSADDEMALVQAAFDRAREFGMLLRVELVNGLQITGFIAPTDGDS